MSADARPLVSVIVAAFNAEATLAESLRSALAQSYRDIEAIVVDDGSTDRTADIAAKFAEADPRVTLLRKSHGGVSAARNLGIAHAKGAYVAPLDADDLWHPTTLARQVEAALRAEEPPGFVYTYVRRIDREGNIVESGEPSSLRGYILHRHALRNFVGAGCAVLMSRSALLEAGGYDERLERCEDFLLQLQIASRHPVERVPEYLLGYRLTPGSLSSDAAAMYRSWTLLRRVFRETCPGVEHDVDLPNHAKRCFDTADAMVNRRRFPAAAGFLLMAVRLDPHGTWLQARARLMWHLRRLFGAATAVPSPRRSFAEAGPDEIISTDLYKDRSAAERIRRLEERRLVGLAKLDRAHAQRLRASG
jgi:glycosyltransferase involved in cell wall biosynthesis